MGVRQKCSECDKVTRMCRCPNQHNIEYVVCDDCKKAAGEKAIAEAQTTTDAPEQPQADASPSEEAAPTQVYLHDVHSPKSFDEQGNFQFILDENRSPQEIVAFAAGMDYGVRTHLDLLIETLRRVMDHQEHREATALLAVLDKAKAREAANGNV